MTATPHEYYDSFAEELLAKFRRVGHLVAHKSSTGTYHEEILRVILRNFLSRRYSVKTGFVYKNEGEVSNQVDVLVVDEYHASAYVYQEGDFAIVRPHATVAAIEVKSVLRADSFDGGLLNIASVKRLTDDPDDICGMVFGYDGTLPSRTNLDSWFKRKVGTELAATPRLGPTLIFFFQHKELLARFEAGLIDEGTNYHEFVSTTQLSTPPRLASEGWQLRIMLAMIYAACAKQERDRTGKAPFQDAIRELLLFSGAVPAVDHYEFGKGLVPRVREPQAGRGSNEAVT
jgi:hypothetical protein